MKVRRPKNFAVQPPVDGVRYELGDNYLSNLKPGKPDPNPVEFYLFIDRYGPKSSSHFVWTLEAPTEEECLVLLRELASRPDVQLVEENTHRVISKEWLQEGPHGM